MSDPLDLFSLGPETPVVAPPSAADSLDLGPDPFFNTHAREESKTIQNSEPSKNVAEFLGETVISGITLTLDWRQKKNIALLAKALFMQEQAITGQAILHLWPQGLNEKGQVKKTITDPDERGRVFRAGARPDLHEVQEFLFTQEYRESMASMGIEIDPNDTGLTAEQIGFMVILSNIADGKSLRSKLRDAGVTWAQYQVWMKQPAFKAYYEKTMQDTLKEAVPFAVQQLAAKAAAGDTAAGKLAFEITGFHDPANKKQVDAQMLMQIILDIIEEEVKDQKILLNIAAKFQLRGARALGSPES